MHNPVIYLTCIAAGLPPIHATVAHNLIAHLDSFEFTDLIVVVFRERKRVYSSTGSLDPDHRSRDGAYEHAAIVHMGDWISMNAPSFEARILWTKRDGFSKAELPPEWFE